MLQGWIIDNPHQTLYWSWPCFLYSMFFGTALGGHTYQTSLASTAAWEVLAAEEAAEKEVFLY